MNHSESTSAKRNRSEKRQGAMNYLLPEYKEIETHSPIGKKLGGIVEFDLKVRIPKNYLHAIAEVLEAGYLTGPTVFSELNYQLVLGAALELDSVQLSGDSERVKEIIAKWNIVYDMQNGDRIESIIKNTTGVKA